MAPVSVTVPSAARFSEQPPAPAFQRSKQKLPAARLPPPNPRWFTRKAELMSRLVPGAAERPLGKETIPDWLSMRSASRHWLPSAETRMAKLSLPINPVSALPTKPRW
jgi:hypothetical protein